MALGRSRPLALSALFMMGVSALASWGAAVAADVDEIVVTARKRQESLQEVPLSIGVFDADALRERNIQSIFDVATFTPNFSFNRNSVGRRLDAPSIRGQFTPLANFGSEANVAFYVDGVYVSGTASTLTNDNLQRVEVVRGPQAALFGRAAFAGAVNYITREPTNEFEGQVNLKAGTEKDYKAATWVSGPIVPDKLLFFASVGYESFDGEWRNDLKPCAPGQPDGENGCSKVNRGGGTWSTGQPPSSVLNDFTPLGGESSWNATGKLTWNALDNLKFNVKVEHSESADQHFASLFKTDLNCYVPGNPDDPKAGITNPASAGWYCGEIKPDGLRARMNIADLRAGATSTYGTAAPAPFIGTTTDTDRYLAEGILGVSGWTVVGRATYNEQQLESYRDLDRSPSLGPIWANLFSSGELQTWKDHSVEVRATSPQDQPLRGTAGIYYFDQENLSYQREYTGFCDRTEFGLPVVNGNPGWNLNGEKQNLAVFGGIDYDLASTVSLSVETRYAKDTPEQRAANGVNAKANYYSFTPRTTLTWKLTDDVYVYGLVAKGNKPGGFFYGYFDAPVLADGPRSTSSAIANGDAIIKEETAWTYELGAKTQWLDRRLTANVAIFYIDWSNQAINEVRNIQWSCADTGPTPVPNNVIRNAGKSEETGGEVELTFAATDNLSLGLNYGLANTELKKYDSLVIDGLVDPAVLATQGNLGNSAKGKEAPRVPRQTVTASATYRRPFGDLGADWFVRSDFVYNSKTWIDVENEAYVGELLLLNGRIGVEASAWTAALYMDNITDTDTPLLVSQFPNFAGFPTVTSAFHVVPRRSRNVGLTLQYRF